MIEFLDTGAFKPPKAGLSYKAVSSLVQASRADMDSAAVTDKQVLECISDTYNRGDGYVLDPHSAIGVVAAQQARNSSVPMVCLACAHWAKFPDANAAALGKDKSSKLTIPEPLASIHTLPTRVSSQPNNLGTVQSFIRQTLKARGH